jgi:hypothetical protein
MYVLQKFVSPHNTVHLTTGIEPAKVNNSNAREIKEIDNYISSRLRAIKPKFKLGQHLRFNKQKMRFAKEAKQHYSTEFFIF